MGCLGLVVVALLALAVPASIAPASLVGAYVVIGLLALAFAAAVIARARRRPLDGPVRSPVPLLTVVALVTVGYAVLVTVIHAAS